MKVSIIVPIYKVEGYIADCARSVLGQSYPDIEFIFVDDGSPDRSVEILEDLIRSEFPSLQDRVKILRKENGGLPQARLTGLQAATGDYILHVDSDDWIELDAVEKLVAVAERTGADLVHFFVRKEKGGDKSHVSKDREYASPQEYSREVLTFRSHGYMVNKFARRSCYRPDLFYPTINMHEDMVLSGQLLFYCSKVALLPEPLYHYRRNNAGSETRQSRSKRRALSARNFLDLYEFYRDRLEGSPVEPVERELLDRCVWIGLRWDRTLFAERPYLAKAGRWDLRLLCSILL